MKTLLLLVLVGVVVALVGGQGLPSLKGRSPSWAIAADPTVPLGQGALALSRSHPGLTGVHVLNSGRSAFAARMLLVETAQRSLDLQYYIWHDDISGQLLLDAVRRAVERGVRVRLLLDDNGIAGLDPVLAALQALPQVQVRLYNPFVQRRFKPLGYLSEPGRLNRRMHNKSFTADGAVSIVGGRNIGDAYFDAAEGVNFADLDVLALGAVVGEVATSFDAYWNSESAYPLPLLVKAVPQASAGQLIEARLAALGGQAAVDRYRAAVRASTLVHSLQQGTLALEWVPVDLVVDDPQKTLAQGDGAAATHMLPRLQAAAGTISTRFDVVSPYFVPGDEGTQGFIALAAQGTTMRVLTNSLAATDVAAVHAGYAKRRRDLLAAGLALFELKPDARAPGPRALTLGSSSASLHAKTFAIDGERAFVGSFNFDPRSVKFNTEMGFLVKSPALAQSIHRAFDDALRNTAYVVRLNPAGDLEWVDHGVHPPQVWDNEPKAGLMRRAAARMLSWLPIEFLL